VAGSRPPPYSFTELKAFTVAEVLACHGVVPLAGEDGTSEGYPHKIRKYFANIIEFMKRGTKHLHFCAKTYAVI